MINIYLALVRPITVFIGSCENRLRKVDYYWNTHTVSKCVICGSLNFTGLDVHLLKEEIQYHTFANYLTLNFVEYTQYRKILQIQFVYFNTAYITRHVPFLLRWIVLNYIELQVKEVAAALLIVVDKNDWLPSYKGHL